MKDILAEPQRGILAQLARSNVLLGFDFDGTLAPIVQDPRRAELRATTRELLASLTAIYPCVVISGRAMRDVEQRVAGIGWRAVIGNHGVEPCCGTEELRGTIASWREHLAPVVRGLPGVVLEDKAYTLALHYRMAQDPELARAKLLRALEPTEPLGPVRTLHGKCVINVLPLGVPDKGMALEAERERAGCDSAFFIGDDETDEDVFALGKPGLLLTVRVGERDGSQAMYCVRSQLEVDALLSRLIELRQDSDVGRRRAQ